VKTDRLTETKELIRAAYRPILITFLAIGSLLFIMEGITGIWADWWLRVFLFGACEWVLERPIIKVLTRKP